MTYNLRDTRTRTLAGRTRIRADVRRLVRTPGADVIGFQEAETSRRLLGAELPRAGWQVYAPPGIEDAIAWRTSHFSLATDQPASTSVWRMSRAGPTAAKRFPARYLTRVRLHHLPSGRTVEVFDTHVNQFIERCGIPRHNQNWVQADAHLAELQNRVAESHANVTVLTGDLNIDAGYDARVGQPQLPYTRYRGLMQSNYRLLGIPEGYTAHQQDPVRPCRIDYVFLKNGSHVGARMTSQTVLTAYRAGPDASDHAPVLVRFSVEVGPAR